MEINGKFYILKVGFRECLNCSGIPLIQSFNLTGIRDTRFI